jgi:hypothetical protein
LFCCLPLLRYDGYRRAVCLLHRRPCVFLDPDFFPNFVRITLKGSRDITQLQLKVLQILFRSKTRFTQSAMELSNGERQGWPERIATSHQSHQSLSSTQTDITAQKLMMQSPISPNGKDGDVTSGPSGLSGGATLDPRKNNPEFTSNVLAIDTTHNHPTTMKSPAPATTALQTKLKQHTTSIIIATMTIILLGFSIWFIDIEFISEKPLPEHLQLSTRRTILLVNIISHVNVFLASLLLEISYETLRWSLASRNGGVSLSTFLALSKATSFMGITDLIRVRGWHQVLCIQRLASVVSINLSLLSG